MAPQGVIGKGSSKSTSTLYSNETQKLAKRKRRDDSRDDQSKDRVKQLGEARRVALKGYRPKSHRESSGESSSNEDGHRAKRKKVRCFLHQR